MSTLETPIKAEESACDDSNTLVMEDGLSITWMLVTPACATEFLTHNDHNRPLRQNKVAAYVRDIKAGAWKRSPVPIMFDKAGKMIDGQHRCYGIVGANVPVWCLVIRGVDTDVQEVIDTPATRSSADALFLSERVEENHPAVAAVGRAHILWSEGHHPHHHWRPNVNASRTVTHSEITAWFDAQKALAQESPETVTVVEAVTTAREEWGHTTRYLTTPVLALAYMLLAEVDRTEAEGFLTSLNNSEFGDGGADPVRQLQSRLRYARVQKEGMRIGQQLWLIFTAWNAYRSDNQVRFITDAFAKPENLGPDAAIDPLVGKDKTTGQPYYPPVPALV